MKTWTIVLAALGCLWVSPGWAGPAAPDRGFDAHWHDGKAELSGYRLSVERYGQRRSGRAVLIYVTEPFSRSRHVKVEDPARDPADTFNALKLNLVRDFQTGLYDYHTVISVFTSAADFSPVKLAFSASEWCGQVYEELDFREGRVAARLQSYFEGESFARSLDVRRDGVVEDNLFILLRGLRREWLRSGERRTVPFLASPYYRRLTHRPLRWSTATLTRLAGTETVQVPAGSFETDVYVVTTADGREGRFHLERQYPHRVVRWAWESEPAAGRGPWRRDGSESGELTGTARLAYWELHKPGDERQLPLLGLTPPAR